MTIKRRNRRRIVLRDRIAHAYGTAARLYHDALDDSCDSHLCSLRVYEDAAATAWQITEGHGLPALQLASAAAARELLAAQRAAFR